MNAAPMVHHSAWHQDAKGYQALTGCCGICGAETRNVEYFYECHEHGSMIAVTWRYRPMPPCPWPELHDAL